MAIFATAPPPGCLQMRATHCVSDIASTQVWTTRLRPVASPRFSLQGFPLPLCGARNLRRAGEPWKGKSSPTSTVVNPVKRAKHLLSEERASEIPKPMALTPPFGGHSRLSEVPAFAAAPGERTRIHYIRGKSVNGFQTSLLVNGS